MDGYTLLNWGLCLLVAAALGSFANVLVYRLPVMILADEHPQPTRLNLALPNSFCPECGSELKWWHNIPLISFWLLRRRCGFCHAPIPTRYFLIELGVVLIALACLSVWGVTWLALVAFVFLYGLWVASWIDALHLLLPDVLTYGLLAVALLGRAWFLPQSFTDALLGAALGYLMLWLPYVGYLRWRGIEGLGLGDCKLLAAIGAWLGWQAVPEVLLLACIAALTYVGLMALLRRIAVAHLKIALGPFLSLGAVLKAAFMWHII